MLYRQTMLIYKDYFELATLAGMHNLPVQLVTVVTQPDEMMRVHYMTL